MQKNKFYFVFSISTLISILVVLLLVACDNNDIKMIEACKKGRIEDVKRLLNEGDNINVRDEDGNTSLK